MPEKNYPHHIAIILDGNRRFAKRLNLDPWKGHEWGRKKFEKLVDWCKEFNIKELTLYTFSVQNFNRPKKEFNFLMDLFRDAAKKLLKDPRVDEMGMKIRYIGRLEMFPKDIQDLMQEIEEKTKNNNKYFLNFAMGYGGKEEITDAIKSIAQKISSGELKAKDINEKIIEENLYLASEPDLIIRTGGEKRTSNFLMWQSSYSEWIFLDKAWPEFEKEDFKECIEEYSKRERRMGK